MNWFVVAALPVLATLAVLLRDLTGATWFLLILLAVVVLAWLANFGYCVVKQPEMLQSEEHQQTSQLLQIAAVKVEQTQFTLDQVRALAAVLRQRPGLMEGDHHDD